MKLSFNLYFLISFLIMTAQGNFLSGQELTTKTRSGNDMYPFRMDWEELPAGQINLSFFLDKPAGKNGFIELKEGHFYTPEGKRFRIWGVNLTAGASYPEKDDAPRVAELLASLGINAVRFHFLDSDWGDGKSIFRLDTNTTRILDPEQLDKLDYFVSELKKQGIYSNFNLNVGRNFRKGDEVPFYEYLGLAKAVTLFDDRIIELQKEYAKQLLTHTNPYTGKEYRNEPALAFLEIVNENSLVEAWMRGHLEGSHKTTQTSTWIDIPEYYAVELTMKYNEWLNQNLSEEEMDRLYEVSGNEKGKIIPRLKASEMKDAPDLRFRTEARFIIETEDAFYSRIYRYLKDSLKVNQWVAANSDHSHYRSGYALLSSASKLDFVDGHVYWQHPKNRKDPETGKRISEIENTPMVNDPFWSTVVQLSRSAVEGKPYTISETNHPYPSEYSSEGIVTLGAYALLQDWDGIYFYTFEHDDPGLWKNKVPRNFDILHDPSKMANLISGAVMFHRADVAEAETVIMRNYGELDLIEGIRTDAGPRPFFTPDFSLAIPLKYKTRISSFTGGENDFPEVDKTEPISSETGELEWYFNNEKGLIKIDTDNSQGLIGFSDRMETISCQNLKLETENPFVSALLTSLDGKALSGSGKMLFTVSSTSVMSGAKWNDERTYLTDWGELPFTIDNVKGIVTLKSMKKVREIKVSALDESGDIAESVFAEKNRNGWSFEIGFKPTVWYLIEANR